MAQKARSSRAFGRLSPAIQPPDKDSEDGSGRPEREGEGKRQYRNTEHLIHWWAPDRRYRPREAQT
jgi:hypothetical protein